MGVPRPESQFWDPDWALPPEEAPEDPEDNFRTASNLALRFCLALFSRVFSRFEEFDEPEGAFPFPLPATPAPPEQEERRVDELFPV